MLVGIIVEKDQYFIILAVFVIFMTDNSKSSQWCRYHEKYYFDYEKQRSAERQKNIGEYLANYTGKACTMHSAHRHKGVIIVELVHGGWKEVDCYFKNLSHQERERYFVPSKIIFG